jgi:hypothetical protein
MKLAVYHFRGSRMQVDAGSKKKDDAWNVAKSGLKTNGDLVACFEGVPLCTTAGNCVAKTLPNSLIS